MINSITSTKHQRRHQKAATGTVENRMLALFATEMLTNTPTNHVRLNRTHRSALRDAALTGTMAEGRGMFPASSAWSVSDTRNWSNSGKPGACLVRIALLMNASFIQQLRSTNETMMPGTTENPMSACFAQ